MTSHPILISVILLAAAVLFQLGLFDWPPLEEVVLEDTYYFVMASSTSKDIGGNVMRLLKGTKEAVSNVLTPAEMAAPAALYGAPEGAEALSAAIYFDDPHAVPHPRWGLGWAVPASNEKEAQAYFDKIADVSTLPEPMRLIKIGGKKDVLRGRIPWRISMTPATAPMLHWVRYYKIYLEGNYSSDSGREGEEGSVACEVYVTGANDSMEYIDYIILMGDTHEIFDGMFPPAEDDGSTKVAEATTE